MGLRGINTELRSLSELMGVQEPAVVVVPAPRPERRAPVFEAPKDDKSATDAPESDGMPEGMRDAAFAAMAKGSAAMGDTGASGDDAEPEAPAKEPPKEAPKAAAPPKAPAEKPAEKPKAEKPAEEPAEKPAEEPEKEKDADAPRWRIPMDTVFGRTPKSDLERYLKTISATLQAQEGMSVEQAATHIDAVVAEMTKVGLLPALGPESTGDEIAKWSDAAMSRGLASVILDRA